jgi:F-type H+-transporting ATPase subunit delta
MKGTKVAYRYAKSLLEVAQEQNSLQEVYNDMMMVVGLYSESPDLIDYVTSPVVKIADKKAVVSKVFEGKVNELSLQFFYLIIENGRESVFREIVKRFVILYDQLKGVEVAKVVSAVELDSITMDKISSLVHKISGKTVELEQTIDESLIGGYILKLGDIQFDASIKNNIKRLHSEFKENLYIPKL